MAYNHPDGTPIERLMRHLNDSGGTARFSDIGPRLHMSASTIRMAAKDAARMGLISTSIVVSSMVYTVRDRIGQPTPAELRSKMIEEARVALNEAMAKLADLESIDRGGSR